MEKESLDVRVAAFNVELKALLGKYELALGAEAVIQDGKVLAKPIVVDDRKEKVETKSAAPTADGKTETPAA